MKTTAERQKEWRERRKAEGYEMLTIWLDPEVSVKLKKAVLESDTPLVDRQKLINLALNRLLDEHT